MFLPLSKICDRKEEDYFSQVLSNEKKGKFVFDCQYFYLSSDQLFQLYKNKILKDNNVTDYSLLYTDNNDKIRGAIISENLEWDTKHFGFGIARIIDIFGDNSSILEKLLLEVINMLEKKGIKQISYITNIENLPIIWLLENFGFNLAGIKVLMYAEKTQISDLYKSPSVTIRPSKINDVEILKEITKNSFKFSRFFNDSRFNRTKARGVYMKWIENEVKNTNSITFTADYHDEPVGFISYSIDNIYGTSVAFLHLIVVSEKVKNIGIGKSLISTMFELLPPSTKYIHANTMTNNLSAVSLYLRMGFKIYNYLGCFHKWLC